MKGKVYFRVYIDALRVACTIEYLGTENVMGSVQSDQKKLTNVKVSDNYRKSYLK